MKQFMTPGYMAPELLPGQTGMSLRPFKASDINSFAILAYELVHQQQALENINIGLIESVRNGQRPVISSNLDTWLSNLIRECWLENPQNRPTAGAVSHILEDYLVQSDGNDTTNDSTIEANEITNNDFELTLYSIPSSPHGNTPQALEISPQQLPTQHLTPLRTPEIPLNNPTTTLQSKSPRHECMPEMQLCLSRQAPIQQLSDSSADSTLYSRIVKVKNKFKIRERKNFQLESIEALHLGKDVIIVQPTGAGKSLCYVVPALLNPGKVTLVIEPVIAIISDQINSLTSKGIDAVALGRAAGKKTKENFRRVFSSSDNVPQLAFCTPEYLFGTPASGSYLPTTGQFDSLKKSQNLNLVVY